MLNKKHRMIEIRSRDVFCLHNQCHKRHGLGNPPGHTPSEEVNHPLKVHGI